MASERCSQRCRFGCRRGDIRAQKLDGLMEGASRMVRRNTGMSSPVADDMKNTRNGDRSCRCHKPSKWALLLLRFQNSPIPWVMQNLCTEIFFALRFALASLSVLVCKSESPCRCNVWQNNGVGEEASAVGPAAVTKRHGTLPISENGKVYRCLETRGRMPPFSGRIELQFRERRRQSGSFQRHLTLTLKIVQLNFKWR